MTDIPRPRCKHGVTPRVQRGPGVELSFALEPSRYLPGRPSLVYDCPTPWACAAEAYRTPPLPQDGNG